MGFVQRASLFSWMHRLSTRMRPSWLIRRNKGEETSESQALSWHKGGPGENKGVESDRVLSAWEEIRRHYRRSGGPVLQSVVIDSK